MQEKRKVNSSPKYKIFETETFREDLYNITKSGLKTILDKLHAYVYPILKTNPYYGPQIKKLKNWTPSTWRYRIGSWRFFYEINEKQKIIYMTSATHRSDAYKK
jgi:mRNA interferase RelE/StbE